MDTASEVQFTLAGVGPQHLLCGAVELSCQIGQFRCNGWCTESKSENFLSSVGVGSTPTNLILALMCTVLNLLRLLQYHPGLGRKLGVQI